MNQNNNVRALLTKQKVFYKTGTTKDVSFRKNALKKLRDEIILKENAICDAIYNDFRKSKFESLLTETQLVLSELSNAIKNIKKWSSPERISPALANFPSSSWIYPEPYGVVLIMSPWNYPFKLAMDPLIGAIAAGNTVVLKPSELTPNTSSIIAKIIDNVFPKEYVSVVKGNVEVSQALLKEKWDYIFFTGSTGVGKIIYKAAADHLTPVTLELGGKNPCIIDETVNIKLTARRVVWGKLMNGGQTCIAPDYILIHNTIKTRFYEAVKEEINKAYGSSVIDSSDYPAIINQKNFDRLVEMLEGENIVIGGESDRDKRYISPTVIDEPSIESKVMNDEIFGPILPVISYQNEEDIISVISNYGKPLSLYVFSNNKKRSEKLIRLFSFGNGTVNDTISHIVDKNLPFGGVGSSGIGSYHGKWSFNTFSHKKSIVKRSTWIDIPLRYAPYAKKINIAKRIKHIF